MPSLKRALQKGSGDIAALERLLRDTRGSVHGSVFVEAFRNFGITIVPKNASGVVYLVHPSGASVQVNAHNSHKEMSHAEMLALVIRLKREIAKKPAE